MSSQRDSLRRVLVWDLPVRLFHALLILAFAGAWLSSGDDRYTHAHAFFGYLALALVVWRMPWGFLGTRYARFREFVASPRAAFSYARQLLNGNPPRFIGHNPVGSWAVWLLLGMTFVLSFSGVLVLGAQEQQGPLAGWQTRAMGMALADVHEYIAWAGLALIATHVVGVLVEGRVHRENLVRAMIDGRKPGALGDAIPSARNGTGIFLLCLLLLFAAWHFRGYAQATPAQPFLPYTSAALPSSTLWREECGACHLDYHPSLLPARSWLRMLDGQADHFGEDLMLDDATLASLAAFAQAHSAEQHASEAATGIAMTTPATETPLRITDLAYWREQHADIPVTTFRQKNVHGKADCAACHRDAESATFEDGAMRIP